MRIAVFNHPFTDFYSSTKRVNTGALYYIEEIIKFHKTLVFDVVKNLKKNINLPDNLHYLKDYLTGDLTDYSFYKNYYKFGDEKNFNHKKFFEFNPEIIIISSFAFCYFEGYKLMVSYLKKLNNKLIIICGGPGPSSNPQYYIENSPTDYAVKGPAEINLNSLLDQIQAKKEIKLDNVIHKNNKKKSQISIKYDFKPFFYLKKDKAIIQLTRGCPKKCTYCSINCSGGDKYLKADLKKIENIMIFNKIQNIKHIDFEDDNITFDKKYFVEVLKIFKKQYPFLTFSAENGIDFTTLDEDFIIKLIQSGISQWNISLTSTDRTVLKNTKRNYSLENFNKIIDILIKFKQKIIVYFICGLPDDDENNILDTIIYLAKKKVLIGISMFYPVPGAKIIDKINKTIIPDFAKGSSFYQWANINTKKLITFFMITRFINAVKSVDIQIAKQDLEINKIIELFKNSKADFTFNITDKIKISSLGVKISLKHKKIIGIIKNTDESFSFKEYDLDEELLNKFFEKYQ